VKVPGHPYAWKTGYVYEHRFVMEQHLGRFLSPEEVVHHKKEDQKKNNCIENLEVTTSSEHTKKHNPDKKVQVNCASCGKVFLRSRCSLPGRRKGVKVSYCSRSCAAAGRRGKRMKQLRHGTMYAYAAYGCRCDACRRANTQSAAKYRAAKRALPLDENVQHGTTNGYDLRRCRCEKCREAHRIAMALYRSSKRAT